MSSNWPPCLIITQIIGILLIPLITRLYSPDDFGVFQLFLSISGILISFSCLAYQFAIMLPKEDEDSGQISLVLCFTIVTIFSIVSGIIFIILSDWIAQILILGNFSLLHFPSSYRIPRRCFFCFGVWALRKKQFGINAMAQIINSFFEQSFPICYRSLFNPITNRFDCRINCKRYRIARSIL